MAKRDFSAIHPDEILISEFLEPMEISQYRLAKDINLLQTALRGQHHETI